MKKVTRDLIILCASITAAIILARTGVLEQFFSSTSNLVYISAFVAGIFFTSIVTIGPATLALITLCGIGNPYLVALLGAAGAVIGDLVIYLFVKDDLARDAKFLTKPLHLKHLFKFHFLRWLGPIIGSLVIISPLPDELGLALMGFKNIQLRLLVPLLFVLNFFGVLLAQGLFR